MGTKEVNLLLTLAHYHGLKNSPWDEESERLLLAENLLERNIERPIRVDLSHYLLGPCHKTDASTIVDIVFFPSKFSGITPEAKQDSEKIFENLGIAQEDILYARKELLEKSSEYSEIFFEGLIDKNFCWSGEYCSYISSLSKNF